MINMTQITPEIMELRQNLCRVQITFLRESVKAKRFQHPLELFVANNKLKPDAEFFVSEIHHVSTWDQINQLEAEDIKLANESSAPIMDEDYYRLALFILQMSLLYQTSYNYQDRLSRAETSLHKRHLWSEISPVSEITNRDLNFFNKYFETFS